MLGCLLYRSKGNKRRISKGNVHRVRKRKNETDGKTPRRKHGLCLLNRWVHNEVNPHTEVPHLAEKKTDCFLSWGFREPTSRRISAACRVLRRYVAADDPFTKAPTYQLCIFRNRYTFSHRTCLEDSGGSTPR